MADVRRRIADIEDRLISSRHEEAEEFRQLLKAESKSKVEWRQWKVEQVQRIVSGTIILIGGAMLSLFGLGIYEWVQRRFPNIILPDSVGSLSTQAGVVAATALHPVSAMTRFVSRHWRRAPHAIWLLVTGCVSGLVLLWYGTNTFSPPLIIDGPPVPQRVSSCNGEAVAVRYMVRKVKVATGLVNRYLVCSISGHHDMPTFPTFMAVGEDSVLHRIELPPRVQTGESCRYSLWVSYDNDLFGGMVSNPIPLNIEMDDVFVDIFDCGEMNDRELHDRHRGRWVVPDEATQYAGH